MTPGQFADALMAYCAATGGSITSWGRTVKHNAKVGGVVDSAHLLWIAADVVYDANGAPPPGVLPIRESLAHRLGLTLIHEGDHDHVQGG